MKRSPYLFVNYITILLVVTLLQLPSVQAFAATATKVSVMAYNVENLFDTQHDSGKEDYTFLPLEEKKKSDEQKKYCNGIKVPKWRDECRYLDWSEKNLDLKMKNLASVVLQVNGGKGPDILILEEVENKSVLETFVKKYLEKADYKSIFLTEGKDERGIDTAIVTRLAPNSEAVLHDIPFENIASKEAKDTRGILELSVKLPDGKTLVVYANHFPAPFHNKELRIQAYKYLGSLMEQKSKDVFQVAGGDFNTPSKEDAKFHLLRDHVEPHWIIAHKVGYKGDQGSSYYPKDKSWSFLDMLLLSKNLNEKQGWHWAPASFQVVNQAKGQLTDEGFPQSFDLRTGAGMSDHLPVYLELEK